LIYNNLIYFIVVLFILSVGAPGDALALGPLGDAGVFLVKLLIFWFVQERVVFARRVESSGRYDMAERRGTVLAILFFAADIYLLGGALYLSKLPFVEELPVLADLGGIALFCLYLVIMWGSSYRAYGRVFFTDGGALSFIRNNLRSNLAIILPWLILSLAADILAALPLPRFQHFLGSFWGEALSTIISLAVLALVLPVILTRMWGCRPLEPGVERGFIAEICRRHRVGYRDILLWPLHGGQALTAGVVGFIKRSRYILVTQALLEQLSSRELEAVVAHEIGHVKRRHILKFVFIFLAFAVLVQLSAPPLEAAILNGDIFYRLQGWSAINPDTLLTVASTGPVFILMLIYFRYVLGFFMRNFEREADLYALEAVGEAAPLAAVFERIAWLSGNTKDQPCWHHFGLGERIDCLRHSEGRADAIKGHSRRMSRLLFLLLALMGALSIVSFRMNAEITPAAHMRYAVVQAAYRVGVNPNNPRLYRALADLQYQEKAYAASIASYENALKMAPDDPQIINALAWVLLTAEDESLRDYPRALRLAREAAFMRPAAPILDTLALAYWRNGRRERAVQTARAALARAQENQEYYRRQLRRFSQ